MNHGYCLDTEEILHRDKGCQFEETGFVRVVDII